MPDLRKGWSFSLFASCLLFTASARAVNVEVTIDPSGPTAVGDIITVRLSASGWQAGDGEVDAIAFNVDFDPVLFAYVPGSGQIVSDGSEFLALPSQGAGYAIGDDSDDSLTGFGRYIFGVSDLGNADAGSVGPNGPLGSFQLRAIASGPAIITPTTNDPAQVFSDPSFSGLSATGGVSFKASSSTNYDPITYPVWAAGIPFPLGEGDPDDDPDKDLIPNLIEYALDMNPLASDPGKLPSVGTITLVGGLFLTLTYERPAGTKRRSDLRYTHRRGVDLAVWSEVGVIIESISAPDPITELETVVVRSTSQVGDVGLVREFLHLRVEL